MIIRLITKVIVVFGILTTVAFAETNKHCKTYPVKPMKPQYYGQVLLDRVEYILEKDNRKNIDYEVTSWYGGDHQRVWLETEGVHETDTGNGEIERLDVLYGKLISPFWDVRLGAGFKAIYGDNSESRTFGVIGIKGLAPYFFEIDTNFRVSNQGEVLADLETEYDLFLTQRLVFQPRLDTSVSGDEIEELGIGTGINNVEISFRLRYEFKRQFAPYIGLSWNKKLGSTADLADDEGEPTESTDIFIGLRMWF